MLRSRHHLQLGLGVLLAGMVLGLAGCASDASLDAATVRPGDRPECLVGDDSGAVPARADGLLASQRQQRCHPEQTLEWNNTRKNEQPMQVDFHKRNE
ncbi:hypothetical protein [Xanthomonas maliensis]|uniref:hypothetical protein n=1 Tax=Xanthomonas maliensis TaxID=1321368 RepID=UPI00039D4FB1|nr:hypothetical protein [Xanthomonas maliensis]KAB7770851.1 hypothetical protein CKY51_03960 [Xanthomonas maliensis]